MNVVWQVALLLAASRTVIVTVVTPIPTRVPAAGDCVIEVTPQLSVATTEPVKFGTGAWPLLFAEADCGGAQLTITGDVLSMTVTVCVADAVLLLASFAV